MIKKISILMIDDHELVRMGFKRLMSASKDFELIGVAESGLIGLEIYKELKPDVVVMDVSMPKLNGIQTSRLILDGHNEAKIVFYSVNYSVKLVVEAIKIGGLGYVAKSETIEILEHAIIEAFHGRQYLSPALEHITSFEEEDYNLKALSARECETFKLIIEGLELEEIAQRLNVSTKTIYNYHHIIKEKLKAHKPLDLLKTAKHLGLIDRL